VIDVRLLAKGGWASEAMFMGVRMVLHSKVTPLVIPPTTVGGKKSGLPLPLLCNSRGEKSSPPAQLPRIPEGRIRLLRYARNDTPLCSPWTPGGRMRLVRYACNCTPFLFPPDTGGKVDETPLFSPLQ